MIELILAIATAGMLAAALATNIAETERFSSAGQNQILAMSIVQEQIDNARNTSYDDLASWAGNHVLKVNNPDPNYMGCPAPSCGGTCRLNSRPLQVDMVALDWIEMEPSPTSTRQNFFSGTVTERVIPPPGSPYPQTIQVIVEADWQEGSATKKYRLETLVSKNGINNG
jgi:type II secretory pathway pseudopilin PulG